MGILINEIIEIFKLIVPKIWKLFLHGIGKVGDLGAETTSC